MNPDGRRPRWAIADVLARTDLPALLDELAEPAVHATRGRRWHCPVAGHDDQHASVTVHTDHHGHERWRCWSGDTTHRGDAIDLVMTTQHLSRVDALDWLAARAGLTPNQPLPPVRPKPSPAVAQHIPLDPAVVRYAHACERILWSLGGADVRHWLHERGFTDELLRANHVGADPGRHLLPRRRGLPRGTTAAAIFPALTSDGRIGYLQARYLQPDGADKYDNPASALGTNPRVAWTRTASGHTRPGLLVVCEGIPDALTAASAGLAAVGILGSQAPDRRTAAELAAHAQHQLRQIIAVVDADTAGRAWGSSLRQMLAGYNTDLAIVEPPRDGLDLNDWARDDLHWPAAIESAKVRLLDAADRSHARDLASWPVVVTEAAP